MHPHTRARLGLLTCLVLVGCQSAGSHHARASGDAAADARQIHWQRSVDDALALARAEQRPILVALNMDGESASDRIVREQYRDPAFVAMSRHYVCVVASLFRHNPRDYDDQGRRIPCPRLGSCTCGEHIALEPLTYDRFLADGERVAPRHAVIAPDGSKLLDESLSFDLKDIDRALFESAKAAPPARDDVLVHDWAQLASLRSDRGRLQLERAIERTQDEATLEAALASIAAHGDAGSLDALRCLVPRLRGFSAELHRRFVTTVRALSLEAQVANVLRAQAQAIGPIATGEPIASSLWLPLLADLDPNGAATRAYLLACVAVGQHGAQAAVAAAFPEDAATEIQAAIERNGGALAITKFLENAIVRSTASRKDPKANPITDAMPTEEALLAELATLDEERKARPNDAELRARLGKASLDLARRRIESQGSAVSALLIDAEVAFAEALRTEPDHPEWWIERARAAYFRNAFDEELAHAREALKAATGKSDLELSLEALAGRAREVEGERGRDADDGRAIEALRWIADADARLFGSQLTDDPARAAISMIEGLRSFALVAISDYGNEGDWASLASYCGALGLRQAESAIARAGTRRFPGGGMLRETLRQALWNGGRSELAAPLADRIAMELGRDHPARADAEWYAGRAWMLQAEDERREEVPDAALASYAAARQRFERTASLRPDYASNCAFYVAQCWIGTGLANARAGRRQAAADALVAAVSSYAQLATARDGLGYDVLDLVDKIFEWRASGASPVDPMQLLDRLDVVVPEDPFYAVAIADSQLREALRADGRNPERAERETVDAAGERIRMLMGLPDEEGDQYLETSIRLLRRVADRLKAEEDKKALAQADTIWAERNLERGRDDGVREALREAMTLLAGKVPEFSDSDDDLVRVAAALRTVLGEARPRWRAGR
ncbi:MAG: hypothetical protein KDC95_09615 [Planctomycetes bacterium]|nr:hypothetical protein [Planctomycetota bacterium]